MDDTVSDPLSMLCSPPAGIKELSPWLTAMMLVVEPEVKKSYTKPGIT